MAGYIGVIEQAVNVLIFQIAALCFMVALGLSSASGAKIGQQIGCGNIKKARAYFNASNCVSIVVISLTVALIFVLRRPAIRVFTSNEEMTDKATSMMWLACLDFFPDMIQGYLQGPIKALGLQGRVLPFNLTAYWFINVPFAYIFAFTLDMGLEGCWLAMICGQIFMVLTQFSVIMCADWHKAVEESQKRLESVGTM
jgi:MATE family multidrug resistance protein